jgi:glycosyltransferase involved in cell wall biosynthesis
MNKEFKDLQINFVPGDNFACGYYRIRNPFNKLYSSCKDTLSPAGRFHYYGQDYFYTQRICNEKTFESLLKLKEQTGVKYIIDYDDDVWHELPSYNRCQIHHEDNFNGMMKYLDKVAGKVTCTNEFLKDNLSHFLPKEKIEVIPNCLDYNIWRFDKYKAPNEISFFYAGSPTHYDDKSYGDFPKGAVQYLQNQKVNVMGPKPWFLNVVNTSPWVTIEDYPIQFARNALQSKFILSFIEDNYFGNCKSDLKYIEAAAVGRVCLCSDISTYALAHPYQKVPVNVTKQTFKYIVDRANDNYELLLNHQYKVLQQRWCTKDKYMNLFV